ncbi:MAG TPA: hypothetical protein VHM90_09225, partial [Phycisphaerae bacterium]|nr:hypothetical protein [Phycisphaerae bacterium]
MGIEVNIIFPGKNRASPHSNLFEIGFSREILRFCAVWVCWWQTAACAGDAIFPGNHAVLQ